MSTQAVVPTFRVIDPIDAQPDVNSGGLTITGSLEQSAISSLNLVGNAVETQIAGGGRLPFDPATPNFQNINGSVVSRPALGGNGLLLIIVLLVLVL